MSTVQYKPVNSIMRMHCRLLILKTMTSLLACIDFILGLEYRVNCIMTGLEHSTNPTLPICGDAPKEVQWSLAVFQTVAI